MNKQQILNITGLTEKEFYSRYPDQESFCNDYPQACAQLAQAAEGIEVTGSLTSPEEIQKLGKAYGFRTDNNKNFQQDMYNYVAKNKPELFKESISKFGPANAGLTNYGSVQGYRPDAYIGPRVADMVSKLNASQQQSNFQNSQAAPGNMGQQRMQTSQPGSYAQTSPRPGQPGMPATFPGQQPAGGYGQNFGNSNSQFVGPKRTQAPQMGGNPHVYRTIPPTRVVDLGYVDAHGVGDSVWNNASKYDKLSFDRGTVIKYGNKYDLEDFDKKMIARYPSDYPQVMNLNYQDPKTKQFKAYETAQSRAALASKPGQPVKPGQSPQPAQPFNQNPTGGWNIGPAQASSQPAMPARQQAPVQSGQPQMSHMGPWHTNPQGEYTRYYTNTQGDMNPGVTPGAALGQQAYGGEMIKRADGSYSKRGLWDNIRANKGSGKKPTKEMLKQEAKIRAEYAYGGSYAQGGEPNGGMALGQMAAVVDKMSKLRKFVSPDQNLDPWIASKLAVMDHSADAISDYMMYNPEAKSEDMEDMMAYGGVFAEGGEQDETQQSIMAALKQGMKPQEILKKLVAMGLTKEQAVAYIKSAVEHPGSQYDNTYVNESSYNQMSNGGEPQNAGFQALPDYVQEKIMDNMAEGGELDMYAGGGYVVKRSSARKGKTHVVIGPDGTKKYFGDSNLGQHPKDPERKAAFYARHKTNLKNNPYFRAYARATWEEGGEIEDQGGGMFAYGGIHLDPAKKGTFKAQATRMGMSVQQAASHILANKEDYSPAMVKKANFAKNFAKEEGGQIDEHRHGGYIGMDGKFHMAKGSGTFSGNAYYAEGGEEDPNLTAPYDGSNPNAPLPPFDPSAYQAMQLPTGYVGYSKKDPATGQFVPIDNVRKDDLWKHLSGSQRWNTGQTVTQKVGRAAGDIGNAVNYGIAAAGAYSNYLQNNEKQNEYNKYMENMGTTASLYGPSAVGTSRGDYSATGSSYGQFRPNQMGNFSWKGTTSGTQYGAYGGQTMYTIGGGVFDALLTDTDASSPVVYNPLANIPSFRQPNAVDNTYVNQSAYKLINQPAYKLKGLPNGANNDEEFGERLANIESKGDYKALPWSDSSHTKLASSAAGKYQFLWNTHKDKIKELTGVSTKQQFLNNPEAQEAYFNYWDDNILTPEALKLKQQYNLELPLNKIKAAIHQAGPIGARKYFSRGEAARDAFGMDTGKYINRFQEGGIVEMSDTEIKQFLANGGQLEFLD